MNGPSQSQTVIASPAIYANWGGVAIQRLDLWMATALCASP